MSHPTIRSVHPAAVFNEKRRIVFSTFHKDGAGKARTYLEGYKSVLGNAAFAGLKAELDFYEYNRKEFQLTVAADVGDATDFTGNFGGQTFRIDVTTNEEYKCLASYERFQAEGERYKLAIVDRGSGKLLELVDVNFPFCDSCEDGRLFDIALLLSENLTNDGDQTGEFDQVVFQVCPCCGPRRERGRITTVGLSDLDSYLESYRIAQREALDVGANVTVPTVDQHAQNALRYIRKGLDQKIVPPEVVYES